MVERQSSHCPAAQSGSYSGWRESHSHHTVQTTMRQKCCSSPLTVIPFCINRLGRCIERVYALYSISAAFSSMLGSPDMSIVGAQRGEVRHLPVCPSVCCWEPSASPKIYPDEDRRRTMGSDRSPTTHASSSSLVS